MALPVIESFPRPGLIVPGCFWADPLSVGLTDEEIGALRRSEVTVERLAQLTELAHFAAQSLANVPPAGVQEWMPYRRAMS